MGDCHRYALLWRGDDVEEKLEQQSERHCHQRYIARLAPATGGAIMKIYKITLSSGLSFDLDDWRSLRALSGETCDAGFLIIERQASVYLPDAKSASTFEISAVLIEEA